VRVLGIESSCDETAAAVYDGSRGLLSSVVASQDAIHGAYGGVVPELASREHLKSVVPVVEKALSDAASGRDDIDGIAVTAGPGLIGSLLVGLCFAKSLAFAWGVRIFGADHLESHIRAVFLERQVEFPYVALLVSGGHTSLFRVEGWNEARQLGGTLDDAAGEAFDKGAKMMGLGYPGGAVIDRLAAGGDPSRYAFPRARLSADSADFSFSGLKTALRTFLASAEGKAARIEDVCASFQEAVADILAVKAIDAARREGVPRLVLSGGVSANSRLRALSLERGAAAGVEVSLPAKRFCTDNAAMVALLGERRMSAGTFSGPDLNAYAASRFAR
jgi:N6-L-threonylcarbamoyladenine synthase